MLTTAILAIMLAVISTSNIWGAIIGAGLALYGGAQDRKAAKKAQEQQRDYLYRAEQALKTGYKKSGGMFDSARQEIMATGRQDAGSIAAQMAGAGLGGSTVYGNLLRGSSNDMMRQQSMLRSDEANFEMDYSQRLADLWGGVQVGQPKYGGAQMWGQVGSMLGGGIDSWRQGAQEQALQSSMAHQGKQKMAQAASWFTGAPAGAFGG